MHAALMLHAVVCGSAFPPLENIQKQSESCWRGGDDVVMHVRGGGLGAMERLAILSHARMA